MMRVAVVDYGSGNLASASRALAAAAERTGARPERGGERGSAPRAPFRMVFQGRLENGRVTGTYGTPLCRGHVELAPG